MEIRINKIIEKTNVEGPGTRFCIWVQGCDICCEGCANRSMWDPDGGVIYQTYEIISKLRACKDQVEGITLLGGEPFYQANAVCEIVKEAKKLNLSVLVFTGHIFEVLKSYGQPNQLELLNYIDLLIDGKFEILKTDFSRPWIGSSNQRYHFLTDLYKSLESKLVEIPNKIEIRIKENGIIEMNGMGDFDLVKRKIEGD